MHNIAEDNIRAIRAAGALANSMLEQRGLAASYMLDGGNQKWLDELNARRPHLDQWLHEALDSAHTLKEQMILGQIATIQRKVDQKRAEAIGLFDSGAHE